VVSLIPRRLYPGTPWVGSRWAIEKVCSRPTVGSYSIALLTEPNPDKHLQSVFQCVPVCCSVAGLQPQGANAFLLRSDLALNAVHNSTCRACSLIVVMVNPLLCTNPALTRVP
jgi:hypothetical protein